MLKKYLKNLGLISSIMLRKLRLRKKNNFLTKNVYVLGRYYDLYKHHYFCANHLT